MALAEDPSAPPVLSDFDPLVGGTNGGVPAGGVTTANFNPPAGSLILMAVTSDGLNTKGATATVTDSLGNTFTPQVQATANLSGYSGIFTHYLASAQTGYNVTLVMNSVQMQDGNSAGYIAQTYVITGASTVQNGSNVGGTGSNNINSSFLPSALGSYIYGAADDWSTNAILTPTAATTAKTFVQGQGDSWGTFRSTNPTASLTSQTYGYTNLDQHTIAMYEVMPGVSPATIAWLTA